MINCPICQFSLFLPYYSYHIMSISNIKKQIVSDLLPLRPQKIIAYGSLVSGNFTPGKSDIDLLIIKDSDKKLADRYSEARLSLKLDYPFDIFVLTAKELQEKLEKSFFFRKIIEDGEILYEKN